MTAYLFRRRRPRASPAWLAITDASATGADPSNGYISGNQTPTPDPEGPAPVPPTVTYDSGGNLLRAIKQASPGTGMAIALDQGGNLHLATQSLL